MSGPQVKRVAVLVCVLAVLAAGLPATAQTGDGPRILGESGGGIAALLVFGEGRQEVARGSVLAIAEGAVLTAYHLVSRGDDAELTTGKGKKIKVEGIVYVDRALDLAVLQVKGKLDKLGIGSMRNVPEGSPIYALGANDTGLIVVSDGVARRPLLLDQGPSVREVSITAPAAFCGAGVFDGSGALVGMLLTLEGGVKVVLPSDAFQRAPTSGKLTPLGSWTHEGYFESADGAWLTGRLGSLLGEAQLARTGLERVAKIDPSRVPALAMLGDACLKLRDYAAAEDAYRKVLALDAGRPDSQYGMGVVLMRQGRGAEAVPFLRKAVELGSAPKDAGFDLATAQEQVGDFSGAAEAYKAYLALRPESPAPALLHLGMCQVQLGQFPQAVASLQDCLKLQPQDIKTNLTLADAYERAGMLNEAEAVYDGLVRINPQDSKTYFTKALVMFDGKGEYGRALSVARKVMDLNPQDMTSIYNVGYLQHKVQDYDQAVVNLKRVLDANAGNKDAWYYYGFSLYNQKKYREAIAAFQKYVLIVPEDPRGWLLIGVSQMFLKDYEAALPPLQRCVDINPRDPSAQFNLGVVYVNLRDGYSAREVLKVLERLDTTLAGRLRNLIK